jgi:hypothetical protein
MEASDQIHTGEKRGTYLTGGWMGSRAGLEDLEKKEIACAYRKSKHNSWFSSP